MRISDWSSDVCSSDLTAFWTCTGGYGGYGGQSCDSRLKRRPLSFVSGWKGRSTLAGIRLIILTINMFLHRLASRDEDRKSTRLNSVTNAHLVCRLLLEKKKYYEHFYISIMFQIDIFKTHKLVNKG